MPPPELSIAGHSSPAAPNWATFAVELACLRCGYNLRGLGQPRCPECGLTFDWNERIAAAREQPATGHFEYHWRDRPLRSLLYTCRESLRPWRLWRELPLTISPRIGPLLVSAVLYAVIRLAVRLADRAQDIVRLWLGGYFDSYLAQEWIWRPLMQELLTIIGSIIIAAVAFLFLLIFRQTMTRARVRSPHLVRAIILVWLGPMLVGLFT